MFTFLTLPFIKEMLAGYHPNNVLWSLVKAGAGSGFVSISPSCSAVLMGTISMIGLTLLLMVVCIHRSDGMHC